MALEVLVLLVERFPSTPTRPPDSGWEMAPLILLPAVVLVVGTGFACALWFRSEGGWEVTPGRAVGIPVVVASAQLLTLVYLRDLSILVDSFTLPLAALAAIHGLGVVVGAALEQRRWGYVAAAGSVTAIAALLIASWGGAGLHRGYVYLALLSVVLGFLPGYVTAGREERHG